MGSQGQKESQRLSGGNREMKEKIHPTYYPDAKVTCACGNSFITGATKKLIRTEICSKCHPLFTGEYRIVDTAGRVERFKRRYKRKEPENKEA
jgi:large subunit ribosomal protein L31